MLGLLYSITKIVARMERGAMRDGWLRATHPHCPALHTGYINFWR